MAFRLTWGDVSLMTAFCVRQKQSTVWTDLNLATNEFRYASGIPKAVSLEFEIVRIDRNARWTQALKRLGWFSIEPVFGLRRSSVCETYTNLAMIHRHFSQPKLTSKQPSDRTETKRLLSRIEPMVQRALQDGLNKPKIKSCLKGQLAQSWVYSLLVLQVEVWFELEIQSKKWVEE